MAEPLRIGLVAGELSGDRLGAALIKAIHSEHPQVQFEGIAGPQMRALGCRALADAEQIAVMGLAEVLVHLPRLLRLRRRIRRHFRKHPPDVFVGIDAPDFNLALERSLRGAGIPTVHWVSPSVWAWRRYRLRKIRHSVDLMLTLFPFEEKFYVDEDVPARFVGHPLADDIGEPVSCRQARALCGLDQDRPCIALLPGSRQAEIKRLLPVFLEAAGLCRQVVPDLQFVLPVATPALLPLCREQTQGHAGTSVTLLDGQARDAMLAADTVLLASGTATLECMLLRRPMVVAYRMHPLSFRLANRLLRVPHVSLPNNLLGTRVVPEFLQTEATPQALAEAVLKLLRNPDEAAQQVAPFAQVHQLLRCKAAQQAAHHVLARGIN